MSFWEEKIEVIERNELERLQLERLRQTISQAAQSPFYKNLFTGKGISSDSIKTLEHLQDLPLTTKDDLRSGRPEDFLAVSPQKVVRLHVSSGTTGTPTAVYHTMQDLDNWADMVARCLCMAGVTPSDVFQNMVGYGLFTGGLGLHYGAERLGVTVLPAGVGNSRRQINLMKNFGTSVIHIIPSYALKLIGTMADFGVNPREELNLRIAVVGAEPYSEATRRRIENEYGLMVVNSYGLSEMNGPGVAFDCPHQTGLHLWEDNYILEIIDPDTLEPLPAGQTGEVVLTTLCREAMPLIRFRTRDLASIIPGDCLCGRTHRRLSRLQGRTDDMLILKGVNIFPMQVESVLMGLEETGRNYVIVVDKDGDLDKMTVRVEMSGSLFSAEEQAKDQAHKKISQLLRDELLISPAVELVDPGNLPSSEGKAVRVIDNRPKEAG
ncbi:MAG: phenylacetate--CoA ligase [Deltaproteobacteria bacterium]|nr:phenylacetate--CoA ligase [Deltaproteobacteria bacterium]MBW2052315.1 phenylacetate--CoA ligase [Deltaproteobacteria bacterium]MBW2142268.1 phenylacetate--CoA ligase [Deltaproteobacteria bacterium]MBW2323019.1 phenylacetate--CoA ligase [Deltaproteobacteria bacterium]